MDFISSSCSTLDGSQYDVVTPRVVRLFRVSTLREFQRCIQEVVVGLVPRDGKAAAVIVPTRSASEQVRSMLATRDVAECVPAIVSRTDWYEWLRLRLPRQPDVLTVIQRQVIATRAARDAIEAGCPPPFDLKPGLIAELLSFYDDLHRYGRSTDAFERLIVKDLEETADTDRGAKRLLQQSLFLAEAFRAYEHRRAAFSSVDEHTLRNLLLEQELREQVSEVIVTMPDQAAHPRGLYPVDFDLFSRMPRLGCITLVATDAILDSGYRERLDDLLPGLEEERIVGSYDRPTIVVPDSPEDDLYFTWRDREEELRAVGLQLDRRRQNDGLLPSSAAIVVQRSLPYLYLAPSVFDEFDIQASAGAGMPLATAPYVALIDLIFEVVESNFSRRALVALLESPHCEFVDGHNGSLGRRSIQALDKRLRESYFHGGRDELAKTLSNWTDAGREPLEALPALRCALAIAEELQEMCSAQLVSEHLSILRQFLNDHSSVVRDTPKNNKEVAVRNLISDGLKSFQEAFHSYAGIADVTHTRAIVHRWIENQTCTSQKVDNGAHLLDAHAAIYGVFEDVFVAGLVDSDWPEKTKPNIFYPARMLVGLGWPRAGDKMLSARAAFHDLLTLSRGRVWLSTFSLEEDDVVNASPVLEDLAECELTREGISQTALSWGARNPERTRTGGSQVFFDLKVKDQWKLLRIERVGYRNNQRFKGRVGSRPAKPYAVPELEQYLSCPFKYFSRHTLGLDESSERDDGLFLSSKQRGLLLHSVFETFFKDWQSKLTLLNLDRALDRFAAIAEKAIACLGPSERAVLKMWLLGSAASPGVAERVFVAEIENELEIVERLTEHRIRRSLECRNGEERRTVELRGKPDRIDLHADNTFRVIDYKSGLPPKSSNALQLTVYTACIEKQLQAERSSEWQAVEPVYVLLGDPQKKTEVPIKKDIETGEKQVMEITQAIEHGHYPVCPDSRFNCQFCGYSTICRKDYDEQP